MVTFDELKIKNDGTVLDIVCSVEDLPIYNDMYIQRVSVEYYKNALSSGALSDKSIVVYENKDNNTDVRSVAVGLSYLNAEVKTKFGIEDFTNGLFYVVVECDGTLPAEVATMPCGYDSTVDTGMVFDWKAVYDQGIQYIALMNRQCADRCEDVAGFKDYVLLWHSLRMAMYACDRIMIEKLWKKFLRHVGVESSKKAGCGCGK